MKDCELNRRSMSERDINDICKYNFFECVDEVFFPEIPVLYVDKKKVGKFYVIEKFLFYLNFNFYCSSKDSEFFFFSYDIFKTLFL